MEKSPQYSQLICEGCRKVYSGIFKFGKGYYNLCPNCKKSSSTEDDWKKYIKGKSIEERLKEVEIFMLKYKKENNVW